MNYLSEALPIHSGVRSLSLALMSLEGLRWCLKILTEVQSQLHVLDGFRKDTAINILARQKKKKVKFSRVIVSSWQH